MSLASSRRSFLRSAPLAAAAVASALPEALHAAAPAPAAPLPFKKVPGEELLAQAHKLHEHPGNFDFSASPQLPFTCVLTVELHKSAKEFEWHEGRDHIFQVLDGETVYELGGTPQNGRNTKPGEWLAPDSAGATKISLKKGDVLMIPRNTPHRRSTAGEVTFYLISTTGELHS